MKYLKFGILAIAIQFINAGCGCCAEKKQSEEDKALDEICKYFGVSKDHVTLTHTTKASHVVSKEKDEEFDKKKEEAKKEYEKLKKGNNKLKQYIFFKFICKEDNAIIVVLVSDKYNFNTSEIVECKEDDLTNAVKNKENVIIYLSISKTGSKFYKKNN